MALRAVFANWLAAALHGFQPADNARAEPQAQHEGGEAGGARAEREIMDEIEQRGFFVRAREQIQHQAATFSSASTTTRMRLPRLPFTSTASPGRSAAHTAGAKASLSGACRPRLAGAISSNRHFIQGPHA